MKLARDRQRLRVDLRLPCGIPMRRMERDYDRRSAKIRESLGRSPGGGKREINRMAANGRRRHLLTRLHGSPHESLRVAGEVRARGMLWNGGTLERWNARTVERWNGGTVKACSCLSLLLGSRVDGGVCRHGV